MPALQVLFGLIVAFTSVAYAIAVAVVELHGGGAL